ncbi:ATP-binding protein [Haladaptatus sp. DYF46]|uniref:ATP-binding protein n=1 Tax=Haladaptatus sp. DYF46 TaxID=2886041 RepID=UPI001E437EB5|nr:ATP-binding protein [Haladaptatus sp. DYF46]
MFHDRADELDALRAEHERDRFSLVIIYGRRRVGKTELIKAFCENRNHLYHLASQDSAKVQQEQLVEELAAYRDERVPRIESWHDAVDYLGEVLAQDKRIVAIDEFPYLVESSDTILSAFQRLVDTQQAESTSTLILCGSSISVMESDVMGHESPLYGRRTAQIDLQPFTFASASEIIDYPIEERVRSFAVTGGMPMYLALFDYDEPLETNLLRNHLSKTSILYDEPEFLLRTELRNPSRYMSILEAIANGHTTPNEISGQTDIGSGPLSGYLQRLRRLRLIQRVVPVTAIEKKSKRSIYRISDEFLRFWFRFVEPSRSGIEQAPDLVLEDRIMPELDRFVATTFEDICQEALWKLAKNGELNGSYGAIGRWWYGGHEIDIVGLDDRTPTALFAECKWTTTPVGTDLVEDLREKAREVRWKTGERDEEFVLFSKSGFENGLRESLDDRWHLIDLEKLAAVFQ